MNAEPVAADEVEAIVLAAYDLMSRYGIRAVSMDDVAARAEVDSAVLHEAFGSKDLLAAAFLERRKREWTVGLVEAGARMRGNTPIGRLLAIFDVFHDWFQGDDFEACSFINVLLEMGKEHPLGIASKEYLAHIREVVRTLAEEAGLDRPDEFALSWHILMKGCIINAVEGDAQAAFRAQTMARDLIARHTPPSMADLLEYGIDRDGRPRPLVSHRQSNSWDEGFTDRM